VHGPDRLSYDALVAGRDDDYPTLDEFAKLVESATRSSVREWLAAFQAAVRARDYDGGRKLCSPEIVGFGTVASRVRGIERLETEQWRMVWDRTTDFHFHDILAIVEHADLAAVVVEWSSVRADDFVLRQGRATIVLSATQREWLAVHTHFSLVPT